MFHFLCDSIERTRSLTNATSGDCQKAIFSDVLGQCGVWLWMQTPDGDVKLWPGLWRMEHKDKPPPTTNCSIEAGVIFPDCVVELLQLCLILQTVSCRLRWGRPSPPSTIIGIFVYRSQTVCRTEILVGASDQLQKYDHDNAEPSHCLLVEIYQKCIDKFLRFNILSYAEIGMHYSQCLMFVIVGDKKSAQCNGLKIRHCQA